MSPPLPLLKKTRDRLGVFAIAAGLCLSLTIAQAQDGVIRAKPIEPGAPADPAVPVEKLLEFANLLYEYGKYQDAVPKYTEFLKDYSGSPNVDTAWYKLGDSYRRLERFKEAKQCFDTLLKKSPDGPYAGATAYTLAVLTFGEDDFAASLPYFQVATSKLEDPNLRVESQFFHGRALQMLEKNDEAIKEYETLLKFETANKYRDRGAMELAQMLLAKGEKANALVHFSTLAEKSEDAGIRDEARFKAGLLTLDDGDPAKAEAFLRETLESSANDDYKTQAQMALMLRAYEREAYAEVTELYALSPLSAKGRARAQLEIMVANSQRQMKKFPDAIRLYGEIERLYPATPEGTEAGYRKLQCFHLVGDQELAPSVDRYVAAQSQVDAATPFIDLALLLKAEALFDGQKYAEAAAAYRNVRPDKISENYLPVRLYKLGWALTESGKTAEGVDELGNFIGLHPKHELVPSALAKRAATFMKEENLDAALPDYLRLANEYPNSENAEYALYQSALIHHRKNQLREMVEAYQVLLQRFPESKVAGEAYYWIGGGLFDLKEYEKCIEPLKKAREIDSELYKAKTTLRIILAQYHRDDLEQLLAETNAFLALGADELDVPIQVFARLGRALYDKRDLANAERYLKLTSNPDKPAETPYDIWDKLAKIHIEAGKNAEAIGDLDNYLTHDHHPAIKARAMLDKSACLLRLKKTAEATAVGEEILETVRTGPINLEARITLSDIAMADADPQRAVELLAPVCDVFEDPVMTPKALDRIVPALEALGKTKDAEDYRRALKERFPNYQRS